MPPKAIGYIRVSTEEQADSGWGLAAQKARIEAECQRREWPLVHLIVDDGYSAKNMQRPGMTRALEVLERGEANIFIAAKLDRLSRSVRDVCELGATAKAQGWSLVLLDASGIDTSTPHGKAQLQMMAVFAELERELIGQRTREAMGQCKAQGKWVSRPLRMSRETEALILARRQDGMTFQGIAEWLMKQGVPTPTGGSRWHASLIGKTLERLNRQQVPA